MTLRPPDTRLLWLMVTIILWWLATGCTTPPETHTGGVTSYRLEMPGYTFQRITVRVQTPTGEQVHTVETER